MISFNWSILELFADCKGVKYYVKATDGKDFVESEGYFYFSEETVNMPIDQIKESNLIDWINKESIESNLKKQLQSLESSKSIDLPWLAGTFTPQV